MKLTTQLSSSFGAMLVLMSVLAGIAYIGLNTAYSNFVEYRGLARDSNLAGRVQANLLIVRLDALKYLKQQSPENVNDFNKRLALLKTLLNEASLEIEQPTRAPLIKSAIISIREYEEGFNKVQEYFQHRNEIVKDSLDPNGLQMRKNVTDIITSAYKDNDTQATYYASRAQEQLLLGRLYVTKFLVTNLDSDYQRAKQEFTALAEDLHKLDTVLENRSRRNLLNDTQARMKTYTLSVDDVYTTIKERNKIIDGTLNRIGPQVADQLEQVKLSVKKDQDELGPLAQSSSESTITTVISISLIVLIAGLFLSWYIARVIREPIGGEPKEIERLARQIASGDLTMEFSQTGNETGIYGAMQEMVKTLKQMLGQISQSSQQMNTSAANLTLITEQATQGAESQMEHLQHTSQSMVEMSATVQDIAESAQLASNAANHSDSESSTGKTVVAQTCDSMVGLVTRIHDVSLNLENLKQETNQVGSILDVIRGIAGQTNLLALNAAIEAARAGEHGRGFAVVADEVRSLASRTQESTEEIQAMISKLQSEAQRSVNAMQLNIEDAESTAGKTQEAGVALDSISSSVGTILDMNVKIASASEEQSMVAQQISDNIGTVYQTAVDTVKGSEETLNSARELSALANDLSNIMKQFKV
ncbi:methyl-accepting chemotaxis protein [Neptunomonas japonica]|nr:methyl-accepting chemotaxis protein [Neptunomonas japonica]